MGSIPPEARWKHAYVPDVHDGNTAARPRQGWGMPGRASWEDAAARGAWKAALRRAGPPPGRDRGEAAPKRRRPGHHHKMDLDGAGFGRACRLGGRRGQ